MVEGLDLTSVSGVIAATWVIIAAAGKVNAVFQRYQELWAIGFALLIAAASKAGGIGFIEVSWFALVLQAFFAALFSGLAHDKIAKPIDAVLHHE